MRSIQPAVLAAAALAFMGRCSTVAPYLCQSSALRMKTAVGSSRDTEWIRISSSNKTR